MYTPGEGAEDIYIYMNSTYTLICLNSYYIYIHTNVCVYYSWGDT